MEGIGMEALSLLEGLAVAVLLGRPVSALHESSDEGRDI